MNIEPKTTSHNTSSQASGLIWITGFSSSGKTTVSRKVKRNLKSLGHQTIFLDGDDLRSIFGNSWGYDKKSRVELAHVYFRLCSHLVAQGNIVIISAIAMFDELGEWIKGNIPNSKQYYLQVPQDERLKRDSETKKIFTNKSLNDDFYDLPRHADLIIDNHGTNTPDQAANLIVSSFLEGHSIHNSLDRGRNPHWEKYYNSKAAPLIPSGFAEWVNSKLEENQNIIEIGCGNGRDSAYFGHEQHFVTAIDRSQAAIDFCTKTYELPNVQFFAGTIDNINIDKNQNYDIAYSRFVIHAMPLDEEVKMLQIINNLLKMDGLFFLECRSINDPLARKGEILSPTERIDGHYRRFIILDELKNRLINSGFKIEYELESKGLAIHKDEDPVVLRITAKKIKSLLQL